jgi:hypothetical protein
MIAALATRASPQGTLNVAFSFPEPVAQANAPVYLDVKLQNNARDRLRIYLGQHGKWNYDFTIVEPDGTRTLAPPYRQYGPGPSGNITLGPHETRVRRLLLNEWYVFRKPGEYTVSVKLASLLRTTTSTSWQAEFSDKLTLRVEPRNPERLKETCENLAAAAVAPDSPHAGQAAEAAFTLSYVVDPIAVPYLARVLKEGAMAARENAVRGLARVGTADAVEILRSNLTTTDPALKVQIESALSQIRPGT